MPLSVSQSGATKDMTLWLPVTFHGAELPWTLVPVSTIWFAMVRIRLYLTDDVISRFNRHRFKTSPRFDPLDSLELLDLLCQCLWMRDFIEIQGYFHDKGTEMTKEEGRVTLPVLTFLAGADFLPGRPTAEWIPGDGQRLRAVACLQPCAATDLWTWHAWEYRITMATTNMGLNSISGSDSVSQTDNGQLPTKAYVKLVMN